MNIKKREKFCASKISLAHNKEVSKIIFYYE